MTGDIIITDISVSADAFALGRVLTKLSGVELELERIIPARNGVMPLLWVGGAEPAPVMQTLSEDPVVESVDVLTEVDGRTLLEVRWSSDVDSVVRPIIEAHARILSATGSDRSWDLRLQFNSRDDLVTFRERCRDHDVEIHLKRLFNPTWPGTQQELTPEQRDILLTARAEGYFEIPRRTTLTDVADGIGISTNAASQRVRRSIDKLIEASLENPTEIATASEPDRS